MRLVELQRNDIAAARRYYSEHRPISGDEASVLLMLQDEPGELAAIMERERWGIRERGQG